MKYFLIPPDADADFVCQMEMVVDAYTRPYDPLHVLVCMDESPNQLIGEFVKSYVDSKGVRTEDYEYIRNETASIFLANEPLTGEMLVEVRERHTMKEWVVFMVLIAEKYPDALTITIVMDNLSTHKASAFYKFLPPAIAKALVDKFRFVYTPKHGSWLNMAEIGLHVLNRQCLNRRIDNLETMDEEVAFWLKDKMAHKKPINWKFDLSTAREKMRRLYPKI